MRDRVILAVQNMLRHLLVSANGLEGDADSTRFISTLPVAGPRWALRCRTPQQFGASLCLVETVFGAGPAPTVPPTEMNDQRRRVSNSRFIRPADGSLEGGAEACPR